MAGERGVLTEDRGGGRVGEGVVEAEALGDFRERPPVGLGLADRRHEAALARDAALGIGDCAVLLAPGFGRQEDVGEVGRIGRAHHVGDDDEGAARDGGLDAVGVGQAVDRVCRHDPQGLDLPLLDGAEEIDGLQALRLRDGRGVPEVLHQIAVGGIGDLEVGGELVGEAADLAAAHGVGLARHREGAAALAADATGEEVAIEDRIDLVGAGRGLVDALRIDREHLLGHGEEVVEGGDLVSAHAGGAGDRRDIGEVGDGFERSVEAGGVFGDEGGVAQAPALQLVEETGEEGDVGARCDGEVEIGDLARRGAARVDVDDAHAGPGFLGGGEALEEDRVAPREVRADEDDEVGLLQILVGLGYGVGAEGALVAGDRGGHAEARIGVDVGRADEALHQLVGDVIVLGEDLAGDVEGDGIRAVLADGGAELLGDQIEGVVPIGAGAGDLGVGEAALVGQRLGERRALDAETAEVRRMVRVARHGDGAVGVNVRRHAAAGAAVGAGGEDGANRIGHAGSPSPVDHRRRMDVKGFMRWTGRGMVPLALDIHSAASARRGRPRRMVPSSIFTANSSAQPWSAPVA